MASTTVVIHNYGDIGVQITGFDERRVNVLDYGDVTVVVPGDGGDVPVLAVKYDDDVTPVRYTDNSIVMYVN